MKSNWLRTQNRWLCVMVLVLVCIGAVFAQGENAIAVDLIPLVKGALASDSDTDTSFFGITAAYERLVAIYYSIGIEFDLYTGELNDIDYQYIGVAAAFRFYPMYADLEKFFLGASLGYNQQTLDEKKDVELGGFSGLFISLKAGYKILLGDRFFFEPSMSYTYSKTNTAFFGTTPQNIGWQAGLRIGFVF